MAIGVSNIAVGNSVSSGIGYNLMGSVWKPGSSNFNGYTLQKMNMGNNGAGATDCDASSFKTDTASFSVPSDQFITDTMGPLYFTVAGNCAWRAHKRTDTKGNYVFSSISNPEAWLYDSTPPIGIVAGDASLVIVRTGTASADGCSIGIYYSNGADGSTYGFFTITGTA